MKITMTGVKSEQVEQVMAMWKQFPGTLLLMENEQNYQDWTLSRNEGSGTTVTYANGLSRHDTAVKTRVIEGYWTYKDEQGNEKAIHLIKTRNRDGTAMTYCGINVAQSTVQSEKSPSVGLCENCRKIYQG